jgi:hypothetical protein
MSSVTTRAIVHEKLIEKIHLKCLKYDASVIERRLPGSKLPRSNRVRYSSS